MSPRTIYLIIQTKISTLNTLPYRLSAVYSSPPSPSPKSSVQVLTMPDKSVQGLSLSFYFSKFESESDISLAWNEDKEGAFRDIDAMVTATREEWKEKGLPADTLPYRNMENNRNPRERKWICSVSLPVPVFVRTSKEKYIFWDVLKVDVKE